MKTNYFWICLLAFSLFPISNGFSQSVSEDLLETFSYRSLGPTRGGRVTTVAGIASEPGTFYMGATGGGVWKTTDYGVSWKNVSDGFFATPSIGAIRVAQDSSNIVYVGTGSDGIRSNIISGKGMYKSHDSGKTWKHIGLKETGQIGAVEIHPNDPNTVFVAAIGQAFNPNNERGVYRTQDGGENWKQVLFIADTVGISDLEFAPDDPNTLYAGAWRVERKPWTIISGGENGGIYKSVDGGDNWEKLGGGLPEGIIGKIDLAVSQADPNKLYALVEALPGEGGLYISNDRGKTFELISTKKELLDRPFYYCNVDVDPNDPKTLYVSATGFWKSTDEGKTWKRASTPHGDNHDLWINPNDSKLMVQANDGGANISTNGGKTWSSQQNQNTAELYQVEVDDRYPYWLYAGQQDNSTISVPSLPPYSTAGDAKEYWTAIGGCETGPAVPKPGNPSIIYSNCKGRFGVFNRKTGQEAQYYVGAGNMYGHNPRDLTYRFQRVSPIHVSPHDPDVVYHTSQFVHKTTDDGKTWEQISPDLTAFEDDKQVISGFPITRDVTGEEFYSTIYAIRESPKQAGVIWVGANDGPVHVTQNGGGAWKNVTPKDLAPNGRIDCVEPSPHKAGKAYFSALRYQLGDWKPYIFKTNDFGKNWELITTGIPVDHPVRVVREDPKQEGLLYAGTEYGIFISFDDGDNWQAFQQNLPVTPITDIKCHRGDLVLSTMGRGFWVMDNRTALTHIGNVVVTEAALQPIEDVMRLRYRGNGKNSVPHFPSTGVEIGYYLPEKSGEKLRIDILNDQGQSIASMESAKKDTAKKKKEEADMATGFFRGRAKPTLKNAKGMNKVRWDMRHRGPWDANVKKSGNGGPMVAPGDYLAVMQIGDKRYRQAFKILPNPNLVAAGISIEDLLAQEELVLKVRDLRSDAKKLLHQVEESMKKEETDALVQLRDALKTQEGRYMVPQLVAQLSYLASMLDRADQRPGKDAYDRYATLSARFEQLVATAQRAGLEDVSGD